MKCIKAHGSCSKCGRYSEAQGADDEDATDLLNHEHGHEFGHAFHGVPDYDDVDNAKPAKRKPRRVT